MSQQYIRPSVYLLDKANALKKALEFFSNARLTRVQEKRLVFMSQLDFWDWEIENLIYSFESFAERAEMWEDDGQMMQSIARLGLPVKKAHVRLVGYDRKWCGWYRRQVSPAVKAPYEVLEKVIQQWNKLLDECEKKELRSKKTVENDMKFGANIIPDLSKYRKKLEFDVDGRYDKDPCNRCSDNVFNDGKPCESCSHYH